MNKYQDIINLPHKEPKNHSRMPIENRAAQFAPFAALTGFNAMIKEITRHVDKKRILTEEEKKDINQKLSFLSKNKEKVKIMYFEKDSKKRGGRYLIIEDYIRRIDEVNKEVILVNKEIIKIENIIKINIIED